MDRGVDLAGDERGVYLLGEQSLAPGLSERPIPDRVAARADDLERNSLDFPSQRLGKPTPRLARLRERERRAARAQREKGGRGHRGRYQHRRRRLSSGLSGNCRIEARRLACVLARPSSAGIHQVAIAAGSGARFLHRLTTPLR